MRCWLSILLLSLAACTADPPAPLSPTDTAIAGLAAATPADIPTAFAPPARDSALPEKVVAFAKTLLGTRYQFGCQAPSTGFDCSGFINYVFNHFHIEVPRSSVDFTDKGTTILLAQAKPGDLILFTGTDPNKRVVGHIGIIVSNDAAGTRFIHSSSGKEMAVIITALNDRYKARFVKVIRIL